MNLKVTHDLHRNKERMDEATWVEENETINSWNVERLMIEIQSIYVHEVRMELKGDNVCVEVSL